MDVLRNVAQNLEKNLGSELDQLARECGVVQRERAFTGRTLLLMIVSTLLHKPDATWADFHLTAAKLDLEVTRTAIEKRFQAGQPLTDFLRRAFERALQQVVPGVPTDCQLLHQFTAVHIGDATTIALPDELAHLFAGCGGNDGTSGAALKIQVLWNLKTGELTRLVLEPARTSDAKSAIVEIPPEPGSLTVLDLGYFDLSRFQTENEKGAKLISRYQHGVGVFDLEGNRLNLVQFLSRWKTGLFDQELLLGVQERLRVRFIAIRMPDEMANRRRHKARENARKKGDKPPSAEYLELLGWSLFITNVPVEELTWKEVVVLYRARWQIELLFKLWKSHNRLAKSRRGATAQEMLAIFYAKLLGVVLQNWIVMATGGKLEARSLHNAAEVLRAEARELLTKLTHLADIVERLLELQRVIRNLGGTRHRNDDPSFGQLIADPTLLDWLVE